MTAHTNDMGSFAAFLAFGMASAGASWLWWRHVNQYDTWVARTFFLREPRPRSLRFTRNSGAFFLMAIAIACLAEAGMIVLG